MKNLMKTLAVLFAISFAVVSCNSNDEYLNEQPKSIYAIASSNSDLSSLKAAVDKAGLAGTLDATSSSGYTLFAPSNAAFNTFFYKPMVLLH